MYDENQTIYEQNQGQTYSVKMKAMSEETKKDIAIPKVLLTSEGKPRTAQRAIIAANINKKITPTLVKALDNDAGIALTKEVRHLYKLIRELSISTDAVASHGTRKDLQRGFIVINGIRLDLTAVVLSVAFTRAHTRINSNTDISKRLSFKSTKRGVMMEVDGTTGVVTMVPYPVDADVVFTPFEPVGWNKLEFYSESFTTFDYMAFATLIIMMMKTEWKFLWPIGQHLYPMIQRWIP